MPQPEASTTPSAATTGPSERKADDSMRCMTLERGKKCRPYFFFPVTFFGAGFFGVGLGGGGSSYPSSYPSS